MGHAGGWTSAVGPSLDAAARCFLLPRCSVGYGRRMFAPLGPLKVTVKLKRRSHPPAPPPLQASGAARLMMMTEPSLKTAN